MPLDFVKDIVILRLRGFSIPGFFLLLASLGPLLRWLLSGLDMTIEPFPRATAFGRPPFCVLDVWCF
jgi:hypothetical protein